MRARATARLAAGSLALSGIALFSVALSGIVALPAAAVETPSPAPSAPAEAVDSESSETTGGATYSGDPDAESAIVATEERRIATVRAVAQAAELTSTSIGSSYRLETGSLYTLVLVARKSPYTLDDLLRLAPRTFARQPDGSYLLSENILVAQGASLSLRDSDGLDLHMASVNDAFVSIVTVGGSLSIQGSKSEPATVSSWDNTAGTSDTDTTDGRAYIRVIGGRAEFANVTFRDLGFWSGSTGGVSLTGTDALDIGAEATTAEPDSDGTTIFGKELHAAESDDDPLNVDDELAGFSYVSALITDSTFDGNAFGLFITSAEGVVIRDSEVANSLVDGIIMHRYVTNSEITRTKTHDNALDGITLSRGTSGVVVTGVTSTNNGANGITMNGRPLAEGPSATGTPIDSFGNNQVSDSTLSNNGRYGAEILGGIGLTVESNTLNSNASGVVVADNAAGVVIKNNLIVGTVDQGIALRNAGTDAITLGNTIDGGDIGIYARDAGGTFERNIVENVVNHGIALVGDTGASRVANNSASGSGPSAIDVSRTENAVAVDNDVEEWRSTKPIDVVLRGIFQPLTVMWLLLALLLIVTAFSGISRKNIAIRHPYAHLAPLSTYSKGVVQREALLDRSGTPS